MIIIQFTFTHDLLCIRSDDVKTDPLTNPVIPPWMLNQMNLGPKYERTEQLLDWLTRWSGRNHGIGSKVTFPY